MSYHHIDSLPASVKKLPESAQKMFLETFNKIYKGDNESTAFAVAWQVVKKRMKKSTENGGKYVALSSAFKPVEYYTFVLEHTNCELVINATGDEITFEAVLASTMEFMQNATTKRKFSEAALKNLADQINNFGSTHPDFDHETLNGLVKQYGDNYEMIMNALPKSKGLIKSIKAIYEKGKLWIRGVLDKKYKRIMKDVKGLSIEAISTDVDAPSNTINSAKYLGFTFAVNKNPKISNAVVAKVSA